MDEKVLKTILNPINDFSMLFNCYLFFWGGMKDTLLQSSPLGIDAREHRNPL